MKNKQTKKKRQKYIVYVQMHILYTSVHPAAHNVEPTAKGRGGPDREWWVMFDKPLLLLLSVNNGSFGVLGPCVQKRPKRQQKELKISAML